MRNRSLVSACVVICITIVHAGCASKPPPWRPIPGAAKVTPWEQTRAICDPILQGIERTAKVQAEYRSCMAKNGWTDQARQPEDLDRDAALKREAEQLQAEIQKRRTKNALTLFAGVPPECQPGDPGTEICSWDWTWKAKTQSFSAPIHMTCVLPKNGRPRDDESCRVDRGASTP